MNTIFGKIIEGKIDANKVFENDHVIAIEDIHPIAPVHLLIIPKKEIKSLQDLESKDLFIIQEIAQAAQILAEKYGISEGYRLLTNVGEMGGQSIFHMHFHLVGGKKLGTMG